MGGAGVEQGRRRGAEPPALVHPVEVEHALLAGRPPAALRRLGLAEADAHRDPHPEQLRGLDPDRLGPRLVDEQVTVIQGLQAEEVEVQVGGRVQCVGQRGEVVVAQPLVDPLDRHPACQQPRQRAPVGVAQAGHPVGDDVPAERLLVDVGQQQPPGQPRELGVALDERLGVEQHQPAQVRAPHPRAHRPAQLPLQLVAIEREVIEPDAGERDPGPQVGAVPLGLAAVGLGDRDRGRRRGPRRGRLLGAQQRPLGAVDDVALGDAHLAAEDELLLDEVLHGLDRHVGVGQRGGPLVDPGRDLSRRRRVGPEREERLADGDLDLERVPAHHLARAADEAQLGAPAADRAGAGAGDRAGEHERLGQLELAGVDQRRLGDRREVGDGQPRRSVGGEPLGDPGGRRPHRGPARRRVGHRLAVGQRDRGDRVGDQPGDVAGLERPLAAVLLDQHRGGRRAQAGQRGRDVDHGPLGGGQRGRALELQVLQDLVKGDHRHLVCS